MSYPLPYVAAVPSPLHDGAEIVIEGRISDQANKVTIALVTERDLTHPTPFVLEARFASNEIVRNSFSGSWGTEEKHGGFPVRKGDNVKVKISVRNDSYQVSINEQFFCDFKHRVGKENIRNIYINGDIAVSRVNLPGSGGGHGSHHNNPAVPLLVPVSFHSGSKIHIEGTPTGGQRFTVYLLHGPSVDHDVSFCLDFRFKFGSQINKVIRNSKFGGKWGTEEAHDQFPLIANEQFELVIKRKDNSFKVIINDEKFHTYHSHTPLEHITHLKVDGDVKLASVKV
uniref:Galectin n=1 Tax=Arion vulgaris TaxID=1028688 RepID=A0A0B7AWV4_9EUPU